jgi:hypothetical protein
MAITDNNSRTTDWAPRCRSAVSANQRDVRKVVGTLGRYPTLLATRIMSDLLIREQW